MRIRRDGCTRRCSPRDRRVRTRALPRIVEPVVKLSRPTGGDGASSVDALTRPVTRCHLSARSPRFDERSVCRGYYCGRYEGQCDRNPRKVSNRHDRRPGCSAQCELKRPCSSKLKESAQRAVEGLLCSPVEIAGDDSARRVHAVLRTRRTPASKQLLSSFSLVHPPGLEPLSSPSDQGAIAREARVLAGIEHSSAHLSAARSRTVVGFLWGLGSS